MRGDRIVSGGNLEVEPRGDHVLAEDRPGAARHREHERDARDRPVLDALRTGRTHRGEAARLEVEHREALRVAHEGFGARARREPHLDAPGGVGGAQERLRPRRVVAVDEDGLGAVHGQRLGVRDEAAERQLEVAALLHGALGHHTGPAGLRADQERDRVQRRVARDADRRLDLGEAAPCSLGRVGREECGALLQVGDVRLIRGCPPCAKLLQREHQLHRVEQPDHTCELRRRQPAREADELRSRHLDVDEHAAECEVVERHRLDGDTEVETVRHDEAVDHVEIRRGASVQAHDDAVLDEQLRLGVAGPSGSHEAELGMRRHEQLAIELAPLPRFEAPATHPRAALAARTRPRPPVRTPRCALPHSRRAGPPRLSSCAAVERPGRSAV